jgi:ZIP family zinc transporter
MIPALTASLATWAATAAGAALVFLLPRLPARGMAALLGIAAVLMGWAAIAGLLWPALAGAREAGAAGLAGAVAAVAAGAWAVTAIRRRLTALAGHGPVLGRQMALVMTLHHVPEGMALGLAVAAASQGATGSAAALVLAMVVHNAAEGALVSIPLHREGMSKGRAWLTGQGSGVAEVAGALLGAAAAGMATAVLPWALAAAGGAMLAVVIGDLLPELRALGWGLRVPAGAR